MLRGFGSNHFFFRLSIQAAFLVTIALWPRAGVAGAIYKISGFNDYNHIELEVKDGKVAGEMRPALGYRTPTIKVDGTNAAEGNLNLSFHFPAGDKQVVLKKTVEDGRLTWASQERDSGVEFYRNLDSSFSKAALTLEPSSCGPHYKDLAVIFAPNASQAGLTEFFSKTADLKKVPVTVHKKVTKKKNGKTVEDEEPIETSLEKGLAILYPRRDEENTDFSKWVEVPVGSEGHITLRLRESGLFSNVDLISGACGGSDRSYFVVKRNFLFSNGEFLREKFISFITQTLMAFASKDNKGTGWNSLIGQPTIKKIAVPPYSSSFRIKMATASEVSRRVKGAWDSFFVSFEPTDLPTIAADEYGVVITVERLKFSKRSFGSNEPPDDTYFKDQTDWEAEAEVTTAISSFFARHVSGGWCHYEAEGAPVTKAKCDNSEN